MKKTILLIASFLLFTGINLFANEGNTVMFGVSAGYNSAMYSGSIPIVQSVDNLFPIFQNKSGNGFFGGLTSRISLPFLSGSTIKSSLIGKLSYENLYSYGLLIGGHYPSLVETLPGKWSTVNAGVDYSMKIKYDVTNIELIYSTELFNSNFFVDIGGSMGIAIQNNYTTLMEVVNPLDVTIQQLNLQGIDTVIKNHIIRYENNQRTGILADGKIPGVSNIRFGFLFGIRYDIKTSKFIISPNFGYNYGNKIKYLNFGLDVLYLNRE